MTNNVQFWVKIFQKSSISWTANLKLTWSENYKNGWRVKVQYRTDHLEIIFWSRGLILRILSWIITHDIEHLLQVYVTREILDPIVVVEVNPTVLSLAAEVVLGLSLVKTYLEHALLLNMTHIIWVIWNYMNVSENSFDEIDEMLVTMQRSLPGLNAETKNSDSSGRFLK